MGLAEFAADCLDIIDGAYEDRQPVTITIDGMPIARLTPLTATRPSGSIIGAMKGTVLRYDDPFSPVF